jgi:uncharacterized protein
LELELDYFKGIFQYLILATGIAFAGHSISSGLFYFKDFNRSIKVKGLSERKVKADLAIWSLDLSVTGESLKKIHQTFSKTKIDVTNFMTKLGFTNNEMESSSIKVVDQEANQYGNKKVKKSSRFIASMTLTVSSNRVDLVKSSGSRTIELLNKGIILKRDTQSFLFTSLNNIKSSMLEEATKKADEAAQAFATHSNLKRGELKSVRQGLFTIADSNSVNSWGNTQSMYKNIRVIVHADFFLGSRK